MTIRPQPKPDRYADKAERIDYRELTIAKNPPVADARFRDFARRQGCLIRNEHVCGPRIKGRVVIDFAHYRVAGKGLKGSDLGNGMGLCHDAHMQQHSIGWPQFETRYGINAAETCARIAAAYERKTSR